MTDPNSTPETPGTPTAAPRSRKRSLLIAGGAAVGALALAAGGVAIGAAIADEADDDQASSQVRSGDDRGDDRDDDQGRSDDDRGRSDASSASTERGATSANELLAILDIAADAAEGDPTSIDAENDGAWEVTFHTSDGGETEVRVDADGGATVVSEEADDDSAPAGVLDRATVEELVAAALADTEGTILELSIDDGSTVSYDVHVRGADGRVVELSLDSEFAVVGSDLDD